MMTIWPTRSRSVSEARVLSTHFFCAGVSGAAPESVLAEGGAPAVLLETLAGAQPRDAVIIAAAARRERWVIVFHGLGIAVSAGLRRLTDMLAAEARRKT